jgi:hypothetical protein
MRIKNTLSFGSWEFFIGEPGEEEIRVPIEGFIRSQRSIINAVSLQFDSLSLQGFPKYKEKALEEAKMMNLPYNIYLGKLIEHQICLRHGGLSSGICSSSGFGDKIHYMAEKVDTLIDKTPPVIQRIASTFIKSVTHQKGSSVGAKRVRLGGCGGCGGRRVYTSQGKNLGRAGRWGNK